MDAKSSAHQCSKSANNGHSKHAFTIPNQLCILMHSTKPVLNDNVGSQTGTTNHFNWWSKFISIHQIQGYKSATIIVNPSLVVKWAAATEIHHMPDLTARPNRSPTILVKVDENRCQSKRLQWRNWCPASHAQTPHFERGEYNMLTRLLPIGLQAHHYFSKKKIQ